MAVRGSRSRTCPSFRSRRKWWRATATMPYERMSERIGERIVVVPVRGRDYGPRCARDRQEHWRSCAGHAGARTESYGNPSATDHRGNRGSCPEHATRVRMRAVATTVPQNVVDIEEVVQTVSPCKIVQRSRLRTYQFFRFRRNLSR